MSAVMTMAAGKTKPYPSRSGPRALRHRRPTGSAVLTSTSILLRASEIAIPHLFILINGVSLLKTELSNGQTHHVLVINVQAPPGQEIEGRHRPGDAGTEVRPHPMAHFLAMEDGREHRQHGFHQHARVPGATRTDFH